MTTAQARLVSLVSPWSQQAICKRAKPYALFAAETNETNETKVLDAPEAVEKTRLLTAAPLTISFHHLWRIAWSHWSFGLTPITKEVFSNQRDQLRPKGPLLRPKPAARGAR
jgi:hypothetical protein